MKFDPKIHHRRSILLQGYDYYAQAGGYYVTLVTEGRVCLFGEITAGEMRLSPIDQIAEECWLSIPEHFPNVELGEHVVMPNHVHGIILIHENDGLAENSSPTVGATHWVAPTPGTSNRPRGPKRGSLGAIIGAYKMAVTRRAERKLNSGNVWQRNYYEHILRNQTDWERIAAYILANPSQWADDEESPFNLR